MLSLLNEKLQGDRTHKNQCPVTQHTHDATHHAAQQTKKSQTQTIRRTTTTQDMLFTQHNHDVHLVFGGQPFPKREEYLN